MVQLKPDQLRRLIRKTSNRLLNVVNGNVPVKIANIERFETSYKYLITPKTSVFKKRAIILSKVNTLFLLQVPHNLMMTAEEFILIPQRLYVKEQPHAARVLHDNNIKHKKAQLSYLNRLRPQLPPQTSKTTATKETFTDNVEPQQEQLKLLTDDEEVPVEGVKDEILE